MSSPLLSLPPRLRSLLRRLPPFLLPLILINLSGHMALSGGRVAGSLFALQEGSGEYMVGIFLALFSVIPALTALAVGRWVDREGAVKVMRFGISTVVIGAWVPVLYLSVPTLLLMAVLVGLGFNVLNVAAQHTVGNLVPGASHGERLANFGWFALGHSTSSTLGPLLAGFMIDWLGFRPAFASLALCTCVAAWLVFRRPLPDTRTLTQHAAQAPHASAGSSLAAPVEGANGSKPRVFDLFGSPELRRIYWVNLIMGASWDLFFVVIPVVGHRAGLSASVIGMVFSLFAAGTFGARAAMPWLSRRAHEWQIIRVVTVVVTAVFLLMPLLSHAATLLMLAGFVFGCAVGMSQPNMLSLIHSAAPAGRGGEAVGLRSLIGNGCSVALPLFFSMAVVPLGIAGVLIGFGAFFSSAIPFAHYGARQVALDRQQAAQPALPDD